MCLGLICTLNAVSFCSRLQWKQVRKSTRCWTYWYEFLVIFLYCCWDCLNCPTNAIPVDQTTLGHLPAIKKYIEGIVTLYAAPNPFLLNKMCLNQRNIKFILASYVPSGIDSTHVRLITLQITKMGERYKCRKVICYFEEMLLLSTGRWKICAYVW